MPRQFPMLLGALRLWLLCSSIALVNSAFARETPNILFILSDDQSNNAFGASGNSEIATPNLDKLAEEGTRFTHAYNMGAWNGAVCLASRAMLVSGLSLWNARARYHHSPPKIDINQTWPKRMEALGYETYFTGKWHIPIPATKVFNHVKHVRPGMPDGPWEFKKMDALFKDFYAGKTQYKTSNAFMPMGYNRPLNSSDISWSPTDVSQGGFYQGGKHWSEVVKDDSIEFIDIAKAQRKPFFMYLAFNAPHDPRQAPKAFQDLYKREALSLPPNWLPLYGDRFAIDNDASLRDAALAPFPRTHYATRVHKKEYYASVSHMDTQIGAILEKLKQEKLYNNTYIIFTSDHGLAVGEHGLFGKQNMYEHSLRAPFVIRGPSIPSNKENTHNIYIQDAMATILDIAGDRGKSSLFFESVIPKLNGKPKDVLIYGAYMQSQRMIKSQRYKLIVYPRINKIKLFDLQADPHEIRNLANEKIHTPRIQFLLNKLVEKQKELNDTLNLDHIVKQFGS